MKTAKTSKQGHVDAGDGVELTVTEARGGVRRGVIVVLVVSTLLAAVGLGAIAMFATHYAPRPPTPMIAALAQPDTLKTRTWDLGHLGANGLEKCSAFRRVLKHTSALQTTGGGTITYGERARLDAELAAANKMPPAALTPMQCGVPL